ncbi:Activity-regulated cytoskeleton-associated protein, partial [Bienertia sinuspersici]
WKSLSKNQLTPPFTKNHPPTTLTFPSSYPKNSQPSTCPSSNQPMTHASTLIKEFLATMAHKGIDLLLFPIVFALSLEPVCQKWFFFLPNKDTATWEDITQAFMARYKGNLQTQTSLRELEILKQGENEGFTTYRARWKEAAATLVSTPTAEEMVKSFISNLQPKYKDHLKYMGLTTFNRVYHIGIDIEDDLLKETTKGSWPHDNKKDDTVEEAASIF